MNSPNRFGNSSGQQSQIPSNSQGNIYLNENQLGNSQSSWALVKEYLRQIKILSNDNLLQSQENDMLQIQIDQSEQRAQNYRDQVTLLERKIHLYQKENAEKIQSAKERIQTLESFNQNMFRNLSNYQTAVMNYESELAMLTHQNAQFDATLKQYEAEREANMARIENLQQTISESEALNQQKLEKYKQQYKKRKEDIVELETELDQFHEDQANLEKETQILGNELRQQIERISILEQFLSKNDQIAEENKNLRYQLEQLNNMHEGLQVQFEELISEYQNVLQQNNQVTNETQQQQQYLMEEQRRIQEAEIEKMKAYEHYEIEQSDLISAAKSIPHLLEEREALKNELKNSIQSLTSMRHQFVETSENLMLLEKDLAKVISFTESHGRQEYTLESGSQLITNLYKEINDLLISRKELKKQQKDYREQKKLLLQQIAQLQQFTTRGTPQQFNLPNPSYNKGPTNQGVDDQEFYDGNNSHINNNNANNVNYIQIPGIPSIQRVAQYQNNNNNNQLYSPTSNQSAPINFNTKSISGPGEIQSKIGFAEKQFALILKEKESKIQELEKQLQQSENKRENINHQLDFYKSEIQAGQNDINFFSIIYVLSKLIVYYRQKFDLLCFIKDQNGIFLDYFIQLHQQIDHFSKSRKIVQLSEQEEMNTVYKSQTKKFRIHVYALCFALICLQFNLKQMEQHQGLRQKSINRDQRRSNSPEINSQTQNNKFIKITIDPILNKTKMGETLQSGDSEIYEKLIAKLTNQQFENLLPQINAETDQQVIQQILRVIDNQSQDLRADLVGSRSVDVELIEREKKVLKRICQMADNYQKNSNERNEDTQLPKFSSVISHRNQPVEAEEQDQILDDLVLSNHKNDQKMLQKTLVELEQYQNLVEEVQKERNSIQSINNELRNMLAKINSEKDGLQRALNKQTEQLQRIEANYKDMELFLGEVEEQNIKLASDNERLREKFLANGQISEISINNDFELNSVQDQDK